MYQFTYDRYVFWVGEWSKAPLPFPTKHARLSETFDQYRIRYGHEAEVERCVVAVQQNNEDPFLIVQQYYWPGKLVGSHPGILYIPETSILFIAAGSRTLAYSLVEPSQLWVMGGSVFKQWQRIDNTVLKVGDSHVATWDVHAHEKWSVSTYGYLHYHIENGIMTITDVDETLSFPIYVGPKQPSYGFEPGRFEA